MAESQSSRAKRWIFLGLLLSVALLILAAISTDLLRRAREMRPATTPFAAILAGPAGTRVKAVVRVGGTIAPRAYAADLLQRIGENAYRQSGVQIRIQVADDAAVVMGDASDIKSGAVIQVSGTIEESQTLHAHQVVILTGYVRVVPQ